MRRLQLGTLTFTLSSFVLAAALVGCGGSKEETPTAETSKPPSKKTKKTASEKKGLASGSGTLKGRVVLEGPKPNIAALNDSLVAAIQKPEDKQHCLAEAPAPEKQQQ